MKKLHSGILGAAAAVLLTACGGGNSSNNVDNTPTEQQSDELESRSIQTLGERDKQYFGECTFSDGSSMPILIEVDDPLNDAAIFLYYLDAWNEQQVESMPNESGTTYWVQDDAGGTLNPDWIWDFALSDNQAYYTGTKDKGTAFECQLKAGLNAETKSQLEEIVNDDTEITEPNDSNNNILGTWKSSCEDYHSTEYIGKADWKLTFNNDGTFTREFSLYDSSFTCDSSKGYLAHKVYKYEYKLGAMITEENANETFAFDKREISVDDLMDDKGEVKNTKDWFYQAVQFSEDNDVLEISTVTYSNGAYTSGTTPEERSTEFNGWNTYRRQ